VESYQAGAVVRFFSNRREPLEMTIGNGQIHNSNGVSKPIAFTTVVIGFLLLFVAACETSYIRYVNTNRAATQQDFMKTRYLCYKETQQRTESAYINQFGGAASSVVLPACSAFNACLAAQGYYRSDTTDRSVFNNPGNFAVPAGSDIKCAR